MKRFFYKYLFIGVMGFGLTSCLNDDVFDPLDQLKKEQQLIDDYLTLNGLTAQTDTATNTLKYIVNNPGDGDVVGIADVGLISLTGRVLDGGVFFEDDSIYVGRDNWIAGYYYLLPYIQEGGSMAMFVPSYYGYGQNSAFDGKLTANTPIKLDVELKERLTQFDYENRLVDGYLLENELEGKIDSVYGLRYVIESAGDGVNYPKSTDNVNVDYKGYLLGSENTFDSNVKVNFDLSNLIQGWRILMPYVSEGGKIIMFIPSKYAYGTTGNSSIPGDATLMFEVTLNEIN